MIIRQATLKDFNALQELEHQLFLKEFKDYDLTLNCNWLFSEEGIKDLKTYITKKSQCAFIAEENNKLLGYLMGSIQKAQSWRKTMKKAKLESFFVLKEFRNQSIGSKLNKAFNNWCTENKVNLVEVVVSAQNEAATRFYRKDGFKDYELTLEKPL